MEETLGVKRFAGFFFVFVIGREQRPLDANFADFIGWQRQAGLDVANANGDAGQRLADGIKAHVQRLMGVGHGAVAVGFAQAVNIADFFGTQVYCAHQLLGRANHGTAAQGAEVACGPAWVLDQGLHHVGRAVHDRAMLALDQRQGFFGVKMLLQHDAGAVREHVRHGIDAAKTPKQGHGKPQPVLVGDLLALANVPGVGDQVLVLQQDALGRGG